MSRIGHMLLIPAALLALALPATAHASSTSAITDCAQDGDLDHHYSNSELRQARANLPSDLDEYSDCREVLSGAITAGSGRGGGHSGSAGHGNRHARAGHPRTHGVLHPRKRHFRVGGKIVDPSSSGLNPGTGAQSLPLPLLLALIAGGLLATAGGVMVLRRRFPALSNLSLPGVPLPRLLRRR
ncbi:MAG: hypothetical protein ABR581_08990 [Thermoleophilaceae bacterium]